MKEYQNYIFDLYGTLADIHTDESSPGFWRDAAGIFAARGAIYDGPALRRAYDSAVARAEARLDRKSVV